jgi:type IV secretion system protein VirD4
MTSHNEEYRFGSARWANDSDLHQTKHFGVKGPQIGYWWQKPLRLDSDAPMLTVGGAGSGKLRDLLGYVVCNSPGERMAFIDPRGELAAISIIAHTMHREHAYTWNPMRIAGLPCHSCNPLDILDPASPYFHSDCKFIAESLIPLSGSSSGHYFELRAREWLAALLMYLAETERRVSLPMLARVIDVIEADPNIWADILDGMLKSRQAPIRRAAGEMLVKQQDSAKEFGAILGELYAYTAFLGDPALLSSLEGDDFSLSIMADPSQVSKLFFNVPAEYLGLWSPLLRLFFAVMMLYKSRVPASPRITLIVDEAGQLGRFEALLRAFTYGRGAGIRAWAIFQDVGQIARNFDQGALQGFIGSAQLRQFFGVRDYETAQLISSMLGEETLAYNDEIQQGQADLQKQDIIRGIFEGGDPFAMAHKYRHYKAANTHQTKQRRALKTPDEILLLPEEEQILFISGLDLPPILANKYPYYSRKELTGKYLPNPYHPPRDRIRVPAWHGSKWLNVETESVPHGFRDYPQYQDGLWSYVNGFRPRT